MPRYGHFDALGSLDGETDAAGTGYFNRFVYRAFGEIASEASLSVPTNWRYVGRLGYYYDRLTTGLPLYVRARWLATNLGRWLSVDPIPQLIWTPYGYAAGSPVLLIDPSGLKECGRPKLITRPRKKQRTKVGDAAHSGGGLFDGLWKYEADDIHAIVAAGVSVATTTGAITLTNTLDARATSEVTISCSCEGGKCVPSAAPTGSGVGFSDRDDHQLNARTTLTTTIVGNTVTAYGTMFWEYRYKGEVAYGTKGMATDDEKVKLNSPTRVA